MKKILCALFTFLMALGVIQGQSFAEPMAAEEATTDAAYEDQWVDDSGALEDEWMEEEVVEEGMEEAAQPAM